MSLVEHPVLFKRTSTGAVQSWKIWVEPCDDGAGIIHIQYGQIDGKLQHTQDRIKQGKNQGKKNATSPFEQAVAESAAKWNKQRERRHYGLTVEESEMKRDAAPMLAENYQDHQHKVDWGNAWVQPKLDGHRCLAYCDQDGKISLFSRKGEPIETMDHIKNDLAGVMTHGVGFDGELYIHGTELRKLGSLIRREQEGSKNVNYRVYDAKLNNYEPFQARYAFLREHLKISAMHFDSSDSGPPVRLVEAVKVGDEETAMMFQRDCIVVGYEGAMLRHGDTVYESGKRSQSLLKMKTFFDAEFRIVGCKEGRGSYEGMAIFACKTSDGHEFDVTAQGTHAEKKQAWDDRESHMGKMLTVKYQFFTTTDKPVPFLPVAKGFVD